METNDVLEEVLKRLDTLGETVADGAVAGWEIVVRQQVIEAAFTIIWGIAFLILTFVIWNFFSNLSENKYLKFEEASESLSYITKGINSHPNKPVSWDTEQEIRNLAKKIPDAYRDFLEIRVVRFVSFFSAAWGMTMIFNGVKALLNPGYYALQDILDKL